MMIKTHSSQLFEITVFSLFLILGSIIYFGRPLWDRAEVMALADQCAIYAMPTAASPFAPSSQLYSNPSLEALDANGQPTDWLHGAWGDNNGTTSVASPGRTGRVATKAEITRHATGDAAWSYPALPVAEGTAYIFNDYYKANVETKVSAQVNYADGREAYLRLGKLAPSAEWRSATFSVIAPKGSVSIAIIHTLPSVGYLLTDDFSFGSFTPQMLDRGMISLTFDDGVNETFDNAIPLLDKYGVPSTQYVVTGPLSTKDGYYMTDTQIKKMQQNGHEIGSHSVSHPYLARDLSISEMYTQLSDSYTYLTKLLGRPVDSLATPYGDYNQDVVTASKLNYCSHRSTDEGFNSIGITDPYNLRVINVKSDTTVEDVAFWIDMAATKRVWIIFVLHEITEDGEGEYNYTPEQLEMSLQHLKSYSVAAVTVSDGLKNYGCQVEGLGWLSISPRPIGVAK